MTERSPLPWALSHLKVLERRGEINALHEAAAWIEGCTMTMHSNSREYRWAIGAALFIRQLADERDGIAPWHSDMLRARASKRPLILGKRGSPLMAMGLWHGEDWRHAESLEPVCFEPDVWQPLPKAAP